MYVLGLVFARQFIPLAYLSDGNFSKNLLSCFINVQYFSFYFNASQNAVTKFRYKLVIAADTVINHW